MVSTFRDLIARVFGSDEVEMRFVTPTSSTAAAPQAEVQPASLPAEAPAGRDEAAERRSSQPLVLRPAPHAE